MKHRASLLALLFAGLLPSLSWAYPWPMKNDAGNFNGPLPVSATLGDARGTNTDPRFHRGIDIARTGSVYPITSGTANWDNSSGANAHVRVGDYWYIHLEERYPDQEDVTGINENPTDPTQIGTVSGNHLHFQIGPAGGPYQNPLSYQGGPVNYADTGMPIVWEPTFWEQGSEGTTARQIISPVHKEKRGRFWFSQCFT